MPSGAEGDRGIVYRKWTSDCSRRINYSLYPVRRTVFIYVQSDRMYRGCTSISASIDLFVRETFTWKLRRTMPATRGKHENRRIIGTTRGRGEGFAIVFLHHPPTSARPCIDCKRFVYTCSGFRSATISFGDRKHSHSVCPFTARLRSIAIVRKRFAFTMFFITDALARTNVAHGFISVTYVNI